MLHSYGNIVKPWPIDSMSCYFIKTWELYELVTPPPPPKMFSSLIQDTSVWGPFVVQHLCNNFKMCLIVDHIMLFESIYIVSPKECEMWGSVWCCCLHGVQAVVSGYVDMCVCNLEHVKLSWLRAVSLSLCNVLHQWEISVMMQQVFSMTTLWTWDSRDGSKLMVMRLQLSMLWMTV